MRTLASGSSQRGHVSLRKERRLTLSHSGLSSCPESLSSTSDEGFLDSLLKPCDGGLVRRRDRVGEGREQGRHSGALD